jgi:diguanylate cyclase (GGDEF)-like protein
MKFIIGFKNRIINEFKNVFNRNDKIHYDVMMGIISSIIILLLELVSFFTVDPTSISSRDVYLIASILMLMQLMVFWSVALNSAKTDSILLNILMKLQPIFIVSIGMAVSYLSVGYSDQIYSYIIAVFAASLIQHYPLSKRIFLFVFSSLGFIALMYIAIGPNPKFYEYLRFCIMISIVGYVYTTIQYIMDQKRRGLLYMLEETNISQKSALDKLQLAYANLDQSHRITEGMMKITTEILENDEFDDVLQMILNEAVNVMPKAQAGSILIFNGELMEYRAALGYDLKNLQKIKLKVEDLFQSTFEDMYAPAIIKDLKVFDEGHLGSDLLNSLKENKALIAKAVLTCSFKYDNQFFGLINLDNFESDTIFDETDKRMIKHLAHQIEITIAIHKVYGKAIKQTRYDILTQANSRRYHQELLEKAYEKAVKNKTEMSICTIDLNNLKELNDLVGHDAGDDSLRHFSSIVRHTENDESTIFSRIGGDEFVLVFPGIDAIETSKKIENIRSILSNHPFHHGNLTEVLTFGCGIATYPYDSLSLEELVILSDRRMYVNKEEVKKNHKKS